MGQGSTNVTLFDLDHTLLPIDSDHAWGVFTTRIGWTDPVAFAQRTEDFYLQYQAGTLDIHDYVRFATRAMRERGESAANAAHADFMRTVVRPVIRPEALELVRRHQRAGDTVAIITATNEFVTRPIADAFGVRVIPQTLFFAKDGKFVKRIMGGASYREISKTLEKILELK